MEVLDATRPAQPLRWEDKEYRVRLEADSPLEKYPGQSGLLRSEDAMKLMKSSETACQESAREIGR